MQFWPFDPFFDIFWRFGMLFMIVPFFIFIIVIIFMIKACQSGADVAKGFTTQAPSYAIPDRYQHGRSDGADLRTVRLPGKCPSCGAALNQESIDWVGPLEASCNYCGATVRAKFEPV